MKFKRLVVTDLQEMKNKNAVSLGKRGGKATVNKYGNEYMKELSKKAVEARKRKGSDLLHQSI